MPAVTLTSKYHGRTYRGLPFDYWWDLTPSQVARLGVGGSLILVQKDTGRQTCIAQVELMPVLSQGGQTSRHSHSWGLFLPSSDHSLLAVQAGVGRTGWHYLREITWS